MITQEQREEVIRNNPIRQVFINNGIHVNSKGFCKCPFHNGDNSASLKIYPEQNSWYCFGCHEHGTTIDFIMRLNGCDYKTALSLMGYSERELTWAEKQKIAIQKRRQEEFRLVLNDVNFRIGSTERKLSELERDMRFAGMFLGDDAPESELMKNTALEIIKAERDLEMYQNFKKEWIEQNARNK